MQIKIKLWDGLKECLLKIYNKTINPDITTLKNRTTLFAETDLFLSQVSSSN